MGNKSKAALVNAITLVVVILFLFWLLFCQGGGSVMSAEIYASTNTFRTNPPAWNVTDFKNIPFSNPCKIIITDSLIVDRYADNVFSIIFMGNNGSDATSFGLLYANRSEGKFVSFRGLTLTQYIPYDKVVIVNYDSGNISITTDLYNIPLITKSLWSSGLKLDVLAFRGGFASSVPVVTGGEMSVKYYEVYQESSFLDNLINNIKEWF